MKHYYLYKITNTINNKIYIGVRSSSIIPEKDTKYMGSGKRLKDAYKCYGKSVFVKEILEIFKTSEEMFIRESQIVTKDFINDDMTYNMCLGGFGGDHWSYLDNRQELIDTRRNTKQLSDSMLTDDQRRKKYGRTHWIGKSHKDSTKEKLSASNATWQYKCISPQGEEFLFKGLRKFCIDNDLNADIFRKYANKGVPIPPYKTGPHNPPRINSTGWIVERTLL